MQNVGANERVFWCPRCGTIKTSYSTLRDEIERPMIVDRCTTFLQSIVREVAKINAKQIGLTDCLSTESERR